MATKPKRIKTNERPSEKLMALNKITLFTELLLFLISPIVVPAMYATYGGRIGKTQGDRKLSTPANKHTSELKIIDEEKRSISDIRFYIVR